MKTLFERLPLSLICAFALTVALTPATYAVDGCSSTGFKVATDLNLKAGLFGVSAADFNGDGHLDLIAVPNNSNGELLLLLGRGGTEKFGPPTSVPTGGPPRQLTIGDFNTDGKPDLIVGRDTIGQPSGRLALLLNDGTGKFGAPTTLNLPDDAFQPVVGDLNNDGKLDIVVGVSFSGANIAVFLGNGAGGFSPAANSPLTNPSINPGAALIGDFNEDGKRDLALPGEFFGTVDVLLGDGAGGFGPRITTSTGGGSIFLTAGDFNNDGHLDLLNGQRMLLGNGTGSFAAPIITGLPDNNNPGLAGDVNHDGHLDLVTGSTSGLTIMLGNGTGNLVRGKSYASGSNVFATRSFAVLGDFNEDGKIDLAGVLWSGIGILHGDGTGAFNDALSYQTTLTSPRALVAADFNNDGKHDFAAVGPPFGSFPQGAGVEVALGDGAGNFTQKSFTNFGPFPVSALAAADFNSDGKLDLAVTRPAEGRVYLLLNEGTGGFGLEGFSAPNFFVGFQASAIKAGDFNNDTKADLIVITPNTNNFSVLLGNGSGGFTIIGGPLLQGLSSVFDDLDLGDFDGDGKTDFAVVRSGSNSVNVFRGDGTGHFVNYAIASTPGTPVAVVVRDLSGDGKPDIAVTSSAREGFITQPYVTVLLNNGAGFNPGTNYPTDGAGMLAVGDFNNDSQPDLAMTSGAVLVGSTLDGIAVLTNKGNGQFNAVVSIAAGAQSSHLAVRDFNADGKDDVAVSQFGAQNVVLLLNDFTHSQPCVSINDASVVENDAGTTDAIFTVTLSAASAQTVRVNYFVVPAFLLSGTMAATKGADFENVAGTVAFAPGETTKTISIPVKGDLIDEFDQFFFVALTTPVNAAISDGNGLGTIVDNDAPATITINDPGVAEGTQVQSTATFTVSLNGPSEKPITIDFAHESGTATVNVDYHNFSGTLQFDPLTVSKTISINIIQDNTFEPDETFFVNLSNATNATIVDGQGQATITNDDPQPTITIASSSRTEGAQGTSGNASFDVRLSNPSHQTITVSFATANGNATAGSDYTATSGTLTFNPGETTKPISVQVIGDNADELHETFLVNLSSPTNATISVTQGVATILDDDGPTLSIGSASVTEGNTGFTNAIFTVTLSAPSVQDIFVNSSTTGGTATSNIDFQRLLNSFLFIPAGATSATVTVRVLGDFVIENDEQFTVTLQNPSNATIAAGQGTGTGTIINDDANGKLQFSSQTYSVNEDAGNVVITVNRVDGATSTVTVDFATSNGTAVAGSDYTATAGTLTFNQGETSKSFSVPIASDSSVEADETINLTLSNPGGASPTNVTLGNPSTAVVTIRPAGLLLILEESALDPTQVAAVDALWFLRDAFPVISSVNLPLFNPGLDQNTKLIVFVTNLELAQGEAASSVVVNLVDSNGQSHDVAAEDVRVVPGFNFTQVKFRLPDNLPLGVCNIKIRAHNQETNSGTIRIKN